PQVPAVASDSRTASPAPKVQKKSSLPDVVLTAGGTLSGRVVDHSGKALEGAKVTLRQDSNEMATTLTNKQGVYSFKGLKSGTYGISSGNTDGTFRVWSEKAAPPAAKEHALLVMGENGARGQFGCCDPCCIILTAGVIAAVVL